MDAPFQVVKVMLSFLVRRNFREGKKVLKLKILASIEMVDKYLRIKMEIENMPGVTDVAGKLEAQRRLKRKYNLK